MSIEPDLRWKLRILHMRDAIQNIQRFTADFDFNRFSSDPLVFNATCRCFQILGEAAKKVPDDVRSQYPDIPWKEISRFRDIVVHDYDGFNMMTMWEIIEDDLSNILEKLHNIPASPKDFE